MKHSFKHLLSLARWQGLLCMTLALSDSMNLGADAAARVASRAQSDIDTGHFPAWWHPHLDQTLSDQVRSKAVALVDKLHLEQDQKQDITQLIEQHYARVWAWHQEVDTALDRAWNLWDAARSNQSDKEKDELEALTIMTEQIDPIYATFAPQVRQFLNALHEAIGASKTTELLDHITRSPGAQRTFKAYLEMIPEMTVDQQKILWQRMAEAREASLAAWTGKRIVKIFKKYKVRNEHSIDTFGYDYRRRYEAWAKSQ